MNKFLSIITAIVISAAFYSCSDDDSTSGAANGPSSATSFTATVDGESWTAFEGGIIAGLDSTGALIIFANGSSGTDSSLIVLGTEAPQGGPFTLDTLSGNKNGASFNLFFGAESGSINITAHNANTNAVSGTFNFVTGSVFDAPPVNVTDGVFNNIVYTEE